jgi:hypothetical protein
MVAVPVVKWPAVQATMEPIVAMADVSVYTTRGVDGTNVYRRTPEMRPVNGDRQ